MSSVDIIEDVLRAETELDGMDVPGDDITSTTEPDETTTFMTMNDD